MLILAATPIGNLGDASARLRDALASVPVIASEDTRTTQRLMAGLGIERDDRPRLIALHQHNERERAADILELATSDDVLLLTDAGMPTVSDPGFAIVRAAAESGVPVTILPGPSAVLAALAVSGLPTDRFCFEGFLPRRSGERRTMLTTLAREERTLVFFESPNRLAESLIDLAAVFGDGRRAVVCRELTKLHEEIARGTLAELAEHFAGGTRGEIAIVVAGAEPAPPVDAEEASRRIRELIDAGVSLKHAAAQVAAETGLSRKSLYDAAVKAK